MLHIIGVYFVTLIRLILAEMLLLCFVCSVVSAETGPLGFGDATLHADMQTDRPDFTEGDHVVQTGHLQFELGYTYVDESEQGEKLESHVAPELLARIGVVEDFELRIAWQGYVRERVSGAGGRGHNEGLSDFSLGFKHRVIPAADDTLAFSYIAELGLPVGDSEVTADKVEPAVKLLFAYPLFEQVSLGSNLNAAYVNGDSDQYVEFAMSLSVGVELGSGFGLYCEYYNLLPETGTGEASDQHYYFSGATYAVTKNLQLDVRAGTGLNSASDDLTAGAGISVRI